jgi:hypothetical protein
VLYALRYPFSFGVLVVTFVLAMVVRGGVQRLISGRRQPAWVRANTKRRRSTWLKPYVDPYGFLAVLLGGVGWGIAVETGDPRSRSRGRKLLQLIAGPLVLAGVGLGLLAIFHAVVAVGGSKASPPSLLAVVSGSAYTKPPVLIESAGHLSVSQPHIHYLLPFGQVALFLAGVEFVALAVLAIMPIPPLDGGKLLLLLVPRKGFWQKVRYRLDEENWGVLILLVLALPILFRRLAVVAALGHLVDPLVRSVT